MSTTAETQTEQVSHEITLFAEPIFHFKNFTITNSLLNAWVVVLVLCVVAWFLRKGLKMVPTGIQNFFEIIVNGAFNMADSVTGLRSKTLKILPLPILC